jgi:hypothetical protein
MSPGGGSGSTIELRSFDANCEPNDAFGDRGVESFVPMIRHRPVQSLAITSITPALGGGVILVGYDQAGGLVGRIDSNGIVDKGFGTEGWTEIPSLLETGPVMQEPSGRIVVAGQTDGNLVWPDWVVALSSTGSVEQNFGSKGRAAIPAYHDASIESLASEPNGVIVAFTAGGNMGCWGSTLHAVTSSGSVDQEFDRHMQQAFPGRFGQPPFDAGLVIQGSRILMIGTSQPTCVQQTLDSHATGRAVAFNAKGQLDSTFGADGEVYFKSAMQQPVAVLPGLDHGWFLVDEPPIYQSQAPSQTVLNVVSLKASARINPRFASGGRASVQLPTLGENELFSFLSPVTASVGHAVALIVAAAGGKNLMLFRVGHQ